MSYTTITASTQDTDLQDRVIAAAVKEAWAGGPEFVNSQYGLRLRTYPDEAITTFIWPIAIDNEAAYAYAIDNENPAPGLDPGVISDASLQAGVQVHWPQDNVPIPLPPDMGGPMPGLPIDV